MKDIHRNTIVLQNFTQSSPLKEYAQPYQKYIALKNKIDYYRNHINDVKYSIEYDLIICVSDYCIFNQTLFINDIHNNIENYHLILPLNISMPLELIPFIGRNSRWFQDLFAKYQKSQLYNLEEFLTKTDLMNSKLILFSDNLLGDNGLLINNLIDLDIQSIKDNLKLNNKLLGFL
jgi:hypothetical protein